MKEAKKWINKAKKDIITAEVNLGSKEYEAAAFFSHQAAEKALKALYISKFRRLWKIHDLQQLAVSVGADERTAALCSQLNPHYIATRYPTDLKYTKRHAQKALEEAKMVMEWAKKQLKK